MVPQAVAGLKVEVVDITGCAVLTRLPVGWERILQPANSGANSGARLEKEFSIGVLCWAPTERFLRACGGVVDMFAGDMFVFLLVDVSVGGCAGADWFVFVAAGRGILVDWKALEVGDATRRTPCGRSRQARGLLRGQARVPWRSHPCPVASARSLGPTLHTPRPLVVR